MNRATREAAAVLMFLAGCLWGALANAAEPGAPMGGDALDLPGLVSSVQTGNGWMIAGAVVSLLTLGLRKGVLNRLPWPGAVAWLHDHPAVAMGTPFVVSAIGGVLAVFASGTPFNLATFAQTVMKVGAGAIVAFVGAKTISESQDAGAAESAKVKTLAAANTELLPPKPVAAPLVP